MPKYLVVKIICCTFASQLRIATYWTFSSAGLEHLPYKQRVGGSNPSTSTTKLTYWTFSSAGLEHLPYKQRVGGSNPSTSTTKLTYWTFSSAGLEHLPYKQRVGGSNPSTSTEETCALLPGFIFLYKYSFFT